MTDNEKQKFRYRILTQELNRYEELLSEAKLQKSLIPSYKQSIKELKEWIVESSDVCESCDGCGQVRYDGNNEDCDRCGGTGITKSRPIFSKFD